MLERRTYPLLATVLTAGLILTLTIWHTTAPDCPGPPYCIPLDLPAPAYQLIDLHNSSSPLDTSQLNASDLHTLVDLSNFTYHMNDPVCTNSSPLFVVLVHSAPGNEENRRAIRSTWGKNAHIVFLLGETDTREAQEALVRENLLHHDLVQGSFLDSYRNLTYKHVAGLKWITYHCPGAKYVLKTDDDVFVNMPFFSEFLHKELSPLGARRLVLCEVIYSPLVKRSYRSKWRVSHLEYRDRWYPDYCMGWVILYSPDAVFRLYKEAQKSEYFWIDDVHITGTLLNRINYTRTSLGGLAIKEKKVMEMLERNEGEDFLFSLVPPLYFHQLWELVTSRALREKSFASSQPWTHAWASR